jgi:hypothetical protein
MACMDPTTTTSFHLSTGVIFDVAYRKPRRVSAFIASLLELEQQVTLEYIDLRSLFSTTFLFLHIQNTGPNIISAHSESAGLILRPKKIRLRIRMTLIQIRITLVRIRVWIQLFTSMRIGIRLPLNVDLDKDPAPHQSDVNLRT